MEVAPSIDASTGKSLYDAVTIGKVNIKDPAEVNKALSILTLSDSDTATVLNREYVTLLLSTPLIRAVRVQETDGSTRYIGIVLVGQDETDDSIVTFSSGRYIDEHPSQGEMSIARLKLTEEAMQRAGIPSFEERQKLRKSDEWGQKRKEIDTILAKRVFRSYVKPDNFRSRALQQRIGFVEKGYGTAVHKGELRYELDLDAFDQAMQRARESNRNQLTLNSTDLPEQVLKAA